eukprot:SM000195S05285  [mRNA]  locus=s195:216345:216801:+ [translate_table: standard]
MAAAPAGAPPPVLRLLRQLLPPRPRARAAVSTAAAAALPLRLRSAGPGCHSARRSCSFPAGPGLRQGFSDSLRLGIRCRASADLRLHQASSSVRLHFNRYPTLHELAILAAPPLSLFPARRRAADDVLQQLVIALRGC